MKKPKESNEKVTLRMRKYRARRKRMHDALTPVLFTENQFDRDVRLAEELKK